MGDNNYFKFITMKYFFLFLFCLLIGIISLTAQSLYFDYDISGNQELRILQYDDSQSIPVPLNPEPVFIIPVPDGPIMYTATNGLEIYPNPVETELIIKWDTQIANLLVKIELSAYNAKLIEEVKFRASDQKAVLSMSQRPSGVYYVKIYCSDGRIINHSIIKK